MARILNISQEVEICINWEKLAKDLKEEFDINSSEEDMEVFCCKNETKYLATRYYGHNIEDIHTDDLSGKTNEL